jgi:hypothetical protein
MTSPVVGIISFVVGLTLIITRRDITVALIGRHELAMQAFFGGNSGQEAVAVVTVAGMTAMIFGLVCLYRHWSKSL